MAPNVGIGNAIEVRVHPPSQLAPGCGVLGLVDEVVQLAGVGGQIVKLVGRLPESLDVFPPVGTDGPNVFELVEDGMVPVLVAWNLTYLTKGETTNGRPVFSAQKSLTVFTTRAHPDLVDLEGRASGRDRILGRILDRRVDRTVMHRESPVAGAAPLWTEALRSAWPSRAVAR